MLANVNFTKLMLNSQELGGTDEHMISRLFFDLTIDGKTHHGLYADIKQTVGSAYEDGPLEVTKPVGYRGDFNFEAFREAADKCYRGFIGHRGRAFRTDPKMQKEFGGKMTIRNSQFDVHESCSFEVDQANRSW